jgi:hypothetical protein
VISKQRLAPRRVDEDVSGLEHRHRVVGSHGCRGALHAVAASIDQLAEGAFDRVERAEAHRPSLQESREIRSDGSSVRQGLFKLRWIEDRLDAVSVDGVDSIALDRVGDEVRLELDHARPRVLVPLLTQVHGTALGRLEQRREQKTDGPCADDVHAHAHSDAPFRVCDDLRPNLSQLDAA